MHKKELQIVVCLFTAEKVITTQLQKYVVWQKQ